MSCSYFQICGGCPEPLTPHSNQIKIKTDRLLERAQRMGFAGDICVHTLGAVDLREKVDLQWRRSVGWGFIKSDRSTVIPVEHCPLLTESLAKLFEWWTQQKLKVDKASVRLRVSPEGQWGVWLDMANIAIKELLEEGTQLQEWSQRATIELGQRHKLPYFSVEKKQWKLKDSIRYPWFQTTDIDGRIYPLWTTIGGFTQVGVKVNQVLVETVLQWLVELKDQTSDIIEIGAGAGNFTIGTLAAGFNVKACDIDRESMAGLLKSLESRPDLKKRLEIRPGDFTKLEWGTWADKPHILLLDPPRSGLGLAIMVQIPKGAFPNIVYIACGVEAWERDGKQLLNLGYVLEKLDWVDQFPNSPHYEVISLWTKKTET